MTKKLVVVDEDGVPTGNIVFTFDDQTTETFDVRKCPEHIQERLKLHGASQKIGDSYAGVADEADPIAAARKNVQDTIADMYAGNWRAPRQSGGSRVSDFVRALSEVTGESLEASTEFAESLDKDQTKVWKAKKKVAAVMLRLRSEAATERAKKLATKLAAAPAEDEDEEDIKLTA